MISSLLAGLTRIRLINLRELRTHRLRVLTSLSVVVVSSALLIAVLGTYGSMTESVRHSIRRSAGGEAGGHRDRRRRSRRRDRRTDPR